ncbi:MAG: hypothetical protein ABI824_07380 [Acidobacteriota bacterium]
MLGNPIVVWPPGTFYLNCHIYDNAATAEFYYDCSDTYPEFQYNGAVGVCCPMVW